jgi:pimeloyl-ACP methyl ester carboxylesterase
MSRTVRSLKLLILGVVLVSQGCVFFTLREELSELQHIHMLSGRITNRTNENANIVIVLYKQQDHDVLKVAQSTIVTSSTGQFAVEAPPGTYYLFAFEDQNRDLSWDGRERVGYYGRPDPIVVSSNSPETIGGLDIDLGPFATRPENLPRMGSISSTDLHGSMIKVGQVAGLDDPIFSLQHGSKGYWEPLTFIREVGFSIYFKEKYDPTKIPVLFVHGALGTPSGWADIVNRMDLNCFQPWFYYYPSGLTLENNAKTLDLMVNQLHRYYKFDQLYVVAHSMGGLVARSFILKNVYEDRQSFIRLFISISTPWNGHKLTADGVESAPTVVPSWCDMIPDSPFIASVFERKWPDSVEHYLLFSYRGDFSLFLENNDGTVELCSELDERAQVGARLVRGFNEDHGSVLTSSAVITQINSLLSLGYPTSALPRRN